MRDDDDYVAEAAQWLLYTVLFMALLVQVDVTDDDDADEQTRLSWILICLNMVPVVVSVTYSLIELNDLLHLERYLPESCLRRLERSGGDETDSPPSSNIELQLIGSEDRKIRASTSIEFATVVSVVTTF